MEVTFQYRSRSVFAKLGASLMSLTLAAAPAFSQRDGKEKEHEGDWHETKTPIKHLIVLIGENRTFDHFFATYVPQNSPALGDLFDMFRFDHDGHGDR